MDHYVDHTNFVEYCVDFQPTSGHDFLWIRSYRPENGLEQPYAVLGVESVSLTCTTTALTDIVVNQTSDLNYNYGAVNVSTQSNFQSYSWNITNTANNASVFTSTLSNPSMTFPGEGTYNVCLDIIDSNGCCGTLCEVVEVECQDPVTTFNITGNCPNYTFVPTNLNENFDYTWYINGQAFGSTGVSTYTFTANGTYEIVLEVVNECGEVAKIATTITVDCICPPPLSNFNYVVSCDREANSVAFAFTGSGQGLTYSWSFGDGTTSTLQNPTHSYSGNGTYNVTLTVVDECGNTNTYTQSISVFCIITPSCIRNSNLIEATLDGGIHGITLSQAFTNLGIPFDPSMVNVYSNRHFNIIGTVTFDISTEFINCDFGALGGAKIVLDASLIPAQATNKGISTFYNCDFFGCLQMWQGIESVGHTSNFFGGSISDALYGIHVNNDGHLTTRGVEFNKNFIGMYFTASPSHLIVGNHFTGGGLLPGYQGMPTTANRNLCGIYSGGVTYSYDYTSSSGTYSLNVGDVDDVRNIFDHLENGIICVNTFNINVDNNEFLNLPIDAIPLSSNYGFNTPYRGVGVIVSGGGLFGGVYFEQNKFEQGTLGILGSSIPSVLSVKNNNRFSNVQHGIYAVNNGFIFPLNLIVENENSFDCRSKGVYSNNNAGHYFSIRKNTFNLTGNANQPNPAGFHGSALLPGFFGRSGNGTIYDNDFNIGSINQHSNGGVQISNFKGVDMNSKNVFHFFTPSPLLPSGHGGFALSNMDYSIVSNNEFFNFSNTPRSGVNSFSNVVNNAVCCNSTNALNVGFLFVNAQTDQSTFKQNTMLDNERGLSLALNCKLGDQIDRGNVWTGVSRVAFHTSINTLENEFYAKQSQNTSQKWFWPTQTPSVWFQHSGNNASDECDNICELPLTEPQGNAPLISEGINVLENMLHHDHIVIEAHLAPSKWAKERWLYGFLTKHPQVMENSEALAHFFANVDKDVYEYEDFYRNLVNILTLPTAVQSQMDEVRNDAQVLLNQHALQWAQYQKDSTSLLFEDVKDLRSDLQTLAQSAAHLLDTPQSEMMENLEALKESISTLPNDKPYTAAAQQYIEILMDKLIYGDEYVVNHHLNELTQLAQLCEPLYKETVVLSRNMLAGLGYEAIYDDNNCTEMLEPRKADSKSIITINVMPNPTTGKVSITSDKQVERIIIHDTKGIKWRQIDGDVRAVDISDLANGVYYVTIFTQDAQQCVKKIIKIQ